METLKIATEKDYYNAIDTLRQIGNEIDFEDNKDLQDQFDEYATAVSIFESEHLASDIEELEMGDIFVECTAFRKGANMPPQADVVLFFIGLVSGYYKICL
jgi:hypothetical protein